MKQIAIILAVFMCFSIEAQTTVNYSGNVNTLSAHRNGWKLDSIFVLPVRGHAPTNSNTQNIGRIQVNVNSKIPEYHNGVNWYRFVTENSGYTYSRNESDALFKPLSYFPSWSVIPLYALTFEVIVKFG